MENVATHTGPTQAQARGGSSSPGLRGEREHRTRSYLQLILLGKEKSIFSNGVPLRKPATLQGRLHGTGQHKMNSLFAHCGSFVSFWHVLFY